MLKNINSFVFFGGGTGLSRILKPFIFSNNIPLNSNISAVVSTFDNGGSSGILRSEYGMPALGDIRKVLSSLSSDINSKFLEYRFRNKPLNQHVVGNLILNSYLKKTNSLKSAIEKYKKKLDISVNVNKKNIGYQLNLLKAISLSDSEYIWAIGDDDLITPDSLLILEKLFINYQDVDFFYVNSYHLDYSYLKNYKKPFDTNFLPKNMSNVNWSRWMATKCILDA